MHVVRLVTALESIPVDFFADPDGSWDYEHLVSWAGFAQDQESVIIGALKESYEGFPEGSAVVAVPGERHAAVALVDCAGANVRAA